MADKTENYLDGTHASLSHWFAYTQYPIPIVNGAFSEVMLALSDSVSKVFKEVRKLSNNVMGDMNEVQPRMASKDLLVNRTTRLHLSLKNRSSKLLSHR